MEPRGVDAAARRPYLFLSFRPKWRNLLLFALVPRWPLENSERCLDELEIWQRYPATRRPTSLSLAVGWQRFSRRVERTIDGPVRRGRRSGLFRLFHLFVHRTLVRRSTIKVGIAPFVSFLRVDI